jgi:hypothetical protein
MEHYQSIPRIQDDSTLLGEEIWAFNKLDGQNFCVKYVPKRKEFGPFGSRKRLVDETDDQFGNTVKFFKKSTIPNELIKLVKENSGKGGVFNNIQEITFFFEWWGEHSFAGVHDSNDEMHLTLIDVKLKKKGYIEPKPFYQIFGNNQNIEIPELIYRGHLFREFITDIWNNDWTKDNAKYPTVKEGVVCKRSTQLSGQRMPIVKFKTKWWITELHMKYDDETAKKLE